MKLSLAISFVLGLRSCANGMTEEDLWQSVVSGPDKEPLLQEELGDQSFDASKKPFEQDDFSYWTDMAQIGIRTYGPYFETVMNPDGVSSDHPGEQTTSYIGWDAISEKLAELPIKQENGEATRGNELGLLRLNQAFYPECKDEPEYCGIALGVPQADHKKVRPVLDHVFGTEGFTDGTIGLVGNKWTRDEMRASARGFLASKNSLNVKNDAGVWTTMVLHKMALNIDMTESEAQAFVDFQSQAVILTPLPSFVPDWFGSQLKLDETLSQKAQYLKKYEEAIRANIASGHYKSLDGNTDWLDASDDDAITKTAWSFLDALIFAGGLSVPGVISSGLAAYYTGLTGPDFDINDTLQAPLLVFESIRHSPPVLGVPYFVDGHRHAPLAGMGGYDKTKYGDDAYEFRIRKTLAEYKALSIDWADSAQPVADKPWSSRICPAKSLSYNMILSFWEALDATNWYVDPDTEITRENGPLWWSAFTIHRSCEGMGVHVGAREASRAHANENLNVGNYCSWFNWCGSGFECKRKWWQYSGSCQINSYFKFFGEGCSKNDQCDNFLTDSAGVDLACRFGKCAFLDGNVCEEDGNVEFADYTELPPSDQAATAGAWTVVAGTGGLSAAAVFFLRKPERHLRHAKMPKEDGANDKL
ncbi:hypothetical protein TrVE_jg9327 [Triparma verrucosa]|uniref:Uncharacterized protein n=1 Tax=Triparma verrucosa TaxID=1606542 RepID=A0A9W7FKE2_9STRA|nr:hypothetical protein TrVE_jg9327 [Triparma verrucosa]